MDVLSRSIEETKELAGSIAKKLKAGDILALYGDLGSGKTTFTSYLVHSLGIDKRVQSPTFVIARRYMGGKGDISTVNHIDLYRMESKKDLNDLGLEEIFDEPGAISVIEWPELVEDLLPKETIKIYFKYAGEDERKINVQDIN
jgi:tRNA threonylcarbamoyladenosine biosynthesis protein TsaE